MGAALPRRASWDPHDANRILATRGVDVVAYDLRCPPASSSGGGLGVIRSAHRYGVADVCHNPLQSNVVVTSGMDGIVKFWDLRVHLSSGCGGNDDAPSFVAPPLLKAVRGGHSHWTTRAIYNPFHDQLILTGGSDGIANLWRISSCSSAPLLELNGDEEDDGIISVGSGGNHIIAGEKCDDAANEDEDHARAKYNWAHESDDGDDESEKEDRSKSQRNNESNAQDVRVTRFECSDVTADLAWSAADPWIYATLSHDGAIVVHHVPSKEKYKILL
jgi:WD40 repeat protein